MSFIQFSAKTDTLTLCDLYFFFFFSFPLRLGHHKKQTLPKCGWMRALRSILHSFGDRNLFLWSKNFSFPFMLFNAFKAISSSNKVSSKAQPRYVTWESCFTLIFYSFPAFLIYAYLQKEQIWFYPLRSVCLIYYQRTNRKHFQNPCLVIFQFF